jgi:hypothetical protein
MRKALNDNPVAQIAIVGVLLVVVGLVAMGAMKKDSGSAAPASPVAEGSTVGPTESATTESPPSPSDPTLTGATTTAPADGTVAVSSAVPEVPAPPLPPRVQHAADAGKVFVLLVVRGGGEEDRLLRRSVVRLRGLPGLALFTTRAKGIARYAGITQGVSVNRVPALVVVKPEGPGSATAEVSYGFRSAESVVQALRDALYEGPTVGYSPD